MPRTSSGRALQADQREPADNRHVTVEHAAGDLYRIAVRGHELWADHPGVSGGDGDLAPTPTELFVASLASCTAFYAGRYLTRHGLDRAGLRVDAEFTMAGDRPARVRGVMLRVTVPRELNPMQQRALAAVVDHCTVHNTLRHPPQVGITIAAARPLRR
ncbi:OsmC family protein [Streptomyces sp. RB6PN25]|uniref:OsmC family protein n=1 Tax=Streptomyces humicola TaxID=2953240 RepID=A0ABT1PWP5_9ACTN|nr:OsmC family protein [Streptomyces humicola]MCQ4082059.1 OsmC family protein [Streptomyces humicola]